jgi:peptidoglycan/LPS O-acetylase OafA/YrhL
VPEVRPTASTTESRALQYRPDIDGLRAVAVMAVLLFHGFPGFFSGGFVGVDVFFVVSGFLITGIIVKELRKGTFTFAQFYRRRISRIFPSLLLVLGVVLAFGWFVLLPEEFSQLGKHTAAGAGFISNIMLWLEAGYFDASAQSKPLLHLWSLGIEEQYYIFWPLILWLLWRILARRSGNVRAILPPVCMLALVSFALNVMLQPHDPAVVFYLPGTRVWELLIGSGLALFVTVRTLPESARIRNVLSTTGALLLLLSFLMVRESGFPGGQALLPTIGAALLIAAGADAWVNRRILSRGWVVCIGLFSYPLYLWHWPALTYFNLIQKSDFHLPEAWAVAARALVLAISIGLAWATWKYWELPIRYPAGRAGIPRVPVLAVSMAALLICGLLATKSILPRVHDPATIALSQAAADWDFLPINNRMKAQFGLSEIGSHTQQAVLFVGDSHMEQFWPRVKGAIHEHPELLSAAFATHPNCPPLPGLNQSERGFDCPRFYDYWSAVADSPKYRAVVIDAFWETYATRSYMNDPVQWNPSALVNRSGQPMTPADLENAWQQFEARLARLIRAGKRVVLLSSTPASPDLDPRMAFHRFSPPDPLHPISRSAFDNFLSPVEARLTAIARRTGAAFIRPADYFCDGDTCPAVGSDGLPLYKDLNHLRARAIAARAVFIDRILRPGDTL